MNANTPNHQPHLDTHVHLRTLVGLDVHAAKIVAAVLDAETGEIQWFRVYGDVAEAAALCGGLVEVRRRTKVIGRFPGETSALSLIWAVLELSSRGWRGVVMTPRSVAEIERLRRAQRPVLTEEVIAA